MAVPAVKHCWDGRMNHMPRVYLEARHQVPLICCAVRISAKSPISEVRRPGLSSSTTLSSSGNFGKPQPSRASVSPSVKWESHSPHSAQMKVKQDPSYNLLSLSLSLSLSFFFCIFALLLFRATSTAHGSSQARAQIGATAAGHSHSTAGSEPCLQPTPQLRAMLDP